VSMTRYPAYKETGIDWLGTVPEHWRVERFKLAVESCTNGVWGEEASNNSNDVVCIRVADFDRQKLEASEPEESTIRNVSDRDIEARSLRYGDLLIEKSGGGEKQPVGAVVLFTGSTLAVCSNFVARMRLAPGMVPSFWRYAHHAAYSLRVNTKSIKQTSGIQNLDQQQYLDEAAAYPPSDEQEEIANFLDRETAKIDALIAEQQRLIELLQEKRQAVISHAVTKGLSPNAPMKDSGVEWLGEVPEHWELLELKRLRAAGSSITYGIVQAGPHQEGGVPYIRTSDMSGDKLLLETCQRTSLEIDEAYSRSRVHKGDLVIAIRATVGKALEVPQELDGANLTQGTAKFSPGERVTSAFVKLAFSSSYCQAQIGSCAKGATFLEITLDALRRLIFAVPPMDEQVQIVECILGRCLKLDMLIKQAMEASTILAERRSALISAAVTGQIDVRGLLPEAAEQ
jgi:type I restriction enzyme S subunit